MQLPIVVLLTQVLIVEQLTQVQIAELPILGLIVDKQILEIQQQLKIQDLELRRQPIQNQYLMRHIDVKMTIPK